MSMRHVVRLGEILGGKTNLSRGGVIVAPYKDAFTNLALEEAIFQSMLFNSVRNLGSPALDRRGPIMLLYVNSAAVVVGSHQIPWREVNVPLTVNDGVQLVRRQSGGGTVFHDSGNLCLSFMTHRTDYNPRGNMEWLVTAIRGVAPDSALDITLNSRHDVCIDGRKITGSAMRLTRESAYHHCTLLVSTDVESIGKYLRPVAGDSSFTASLNVQSVRSPVTSLCDVLGDSLLPRPTAVDRVRSHLAAMFARRYTALEEGPNPILELDATESANEIEFRSVMEPRSPTRFVGKMREDMTSWTSVFGYSSRFSQHVGGVRLGLLTLDFDITVEKGMIQKVATSRIVTSKEGSPQAPGCLLYTISDVVATCLLGTRLSRADLMAAEPVFCGGITNQLTEALYTEVLGSSDLPQLWHGFVRHSCCLMGWV